MENSKISSTGKNATPVLSSSPTEEKAEDVSTTKGEQQDHAGNTTTTDGNNDDNQDNVSNIKSIKQEDDNEEDEQLSSRYNPSILENDLKDEDLEKMKGDAIGNTLYSERFVLSTLLKLTKLEKNLNDDEEFEKDLCSLWDMSIEKDVVKLLLEHKVLELFSTIIKQTEDKRLSEILVGIIGNMCSVSETRDELCMNSEITLPIFDLISCTDTLTLIQLMRLLHTALVFENSGDEILWFQHFKNSDSFVEHFSYILSNSINSTLLINALEALNAICAKFSVIDLQTSDNDNDISSSSINNDDCGNNVSFCNLFVQKSLIVGINEAFKTLLPSTSSLNKRSLPQALEIHKKIIKNSKFDISDDFDKDSTLNNTINSYADINDDLSEIENCCENAPTQNSQKIMNLFLDIHVFLSQYGKLSRTCYSTILNDLMKCISKILSPLCQPICLLPLTFNEQGIVENVNELFQSLGDPFDEVCFAQMITIWSLIDTNRQLRNELITTATTKSSTKSEETYDTSSLKSQTWDDDDCDNVTTTMTTKSKSIATQWDDIVNDSIASTKTTKKNKSDGGGRENCNNTTEFDEEVNSEDICITILEYLTRTVRNATDLQLKHSLRLHSPGTIIKLLSALSTGDSEPDIQECCIKIKTIFDILHGENNESNMSNITIDSIDSTIVTMGEASPEFLDNNSFLNISMNATNEESR